MTMPAILQTGDQMIAVGTINRRLAALGRLAAGLLAAALGVFAYSGFSFGSWRS